MRFIVEKQGLDGRNLRVDLQGLRGFGVLLVIIGHLWLWPRGAFGALDIFFVLSGFFITEILVDQFGKEGTLRFREFYLARFRRLAPTALTVIAVTIILTNLLFSPETADEVETQGFWAAVFGSNWYFIEVGNDYFANLHNSPLVHYWSLSVEEQFYVVWPLLLWLSLRTARRRGWDAHKVLLAVFGVITVVFFTYSMWHSATDPLASYYSTFDRVWEFGIGGLVAAGRPWLAQIPPRVAAALGTFFGLAVGASIFVLHYGMAFPAPWGLLPVIPCAGLIAAGVSGQVRGPAILRTLPLVYLGTISYSFYLWHLPTNYLLRSYFIEETMTYKFIALGTSFIISVLSFHLLERPLRRARFLMTHRERRRMELKPPINLRPVKLGWAAVLTVLASSLAVLPLVTSQAAPTAAVSATDAPDDLDSASGSTSPQERQAQRVDEALRQTEFPTFDPAITTLKELKAELDADGCTTVTPSQLESCRFGNPGATKTAVVIGDSTSVYYTPGLREALVPEGWSVQQFTRLACPAWTLPRTRMLQQKIPGCHEHTRRAVDVVKQQKPDLLILTTGVGAWLSQARQVDVPAKGAELVEQALSKTLETMKPLAKRIVILESPPGTRDLHTCVTRFSTPNDCKAFPSPDWNTGTQAERQVANTFDVEYVSGQSWFCDGACPAFMGTTPVTADGSHLTVKFSKSLAPVLREALLEDESK